MNIAENTDVDYFGDAAPLAHLVGDVVDVRLEELSRSAGVAKTLDLRRGRVVEVRHRRNDDDEGWAAVTTVTFDDGGEFVVKDWACANVNRDRRTGVVRVEDDYAIVFTPVEVNGEPVSSGARS